jgi:hypothetical protein
MCLITKSHYSDVHTHICTRTYATLEGCILMFQYMHLRNVCKGRLISMVGRMVMVQKIFYSSQ